MSQLSRKGGLQSSFHAWRLNSTTFVVQERDDFREIPLIYVKIHPRAPVIVLTDTGCDEPAEDYKEARYIHLRDYLENCPVACNGNLPFNPGCARQYIIICTHCHYDHTLGIPQFLRGGTTQIIASAAGRDFIESDLESNGLFDTVGQPAPYYFVTHWAQAFETLRYPPKDARRGSSTRIELGITFIQTPGHTPDSLAWYDRDEMHLYVGDSVYEPGKENMPIVWPGQGSMIEWVFSMQKLQYFVKSENARAAAAVEEEGEDGWVEVAKRVNLGAGHQTYATDAEELLGALEKLWWATVRGEVPIWLKMDWHGEQYTAWKPVKSAYGMWFFAPSRLIEEARSFFSIDTEL